jgi:hypothetical protein
VTFAQQAVVPGSDGELYPRITCYTHQRMGHYLEHCPTGATTATGTTLTHHAYMLSQSSASDIDPEWILLDLQSTISVFKNRDMLMNVRRSPHELRALTNGGYQDSDMVGDIHDLGQVWYNPNSIGDILLLSDVR